MEMTTNNSQEDDEIRKSRVWNGYAMNGEWECSGKWSEDKHWKGNGTWNGGQLSGTWNGEGDWEPIGNSIGKWKGYGELSSNIPFSKNTVRLVTAISIGLIAIAVIGLVAVAVIGLISNGLVVGGWIVAIALLFAVINLMGKKTTKGKWWANGSWKDVGEFRILEMIGEWKIGIHEGTIQGKMKDPKPR